MICAALLVVTLMPAEVSWNTSSTTHVSAYASMEDCQKAITGGSFQSSAKGAAVTAFCRPPMERDFDKTWGTCSGMKRPADETNK